MNKEALLYFIVAGSFAAAAGLFAATAGINSGPDRETGLASLSMLGAAVICAWLGARKLRRGGG